MSKNNCEDKLVITLWAPDRSIEDQLETMLAGDYWRSGLPVYVEYLGIDVPVNQDSTPADIIAKLQPRMNELRLLCADACTNKLRPKYTNKFGGLPGQSRSVAVKQAVYQARYVAGQMLAANGEEHLKRSLFYFTFNGVDVLFNPFAPDVEDTIVRRILLALDAGLGYSRNYVPPYPITIISNV